MVWEPVLVTDIAPPLSSVLGLISDPRVSQFWDPHRALSKDIVRAVNENPSSYGFDEALHDDYIVWDAVAVFGGDARWSGSLPVPHYYGGPVFAVTDELHKALEQALVNSYATP